MKELTEYRQKLLDRMSEVATEFRAACAAVNDPFAPIEEGGWNTHQLAVHTRDVDKVLYGMRAKRTISEKNPLFQSFDADEWMAAHYNSSEPLTSVVDELVNSVTEFVQQLRGLPAESWSRESRHETLGSGFTMQTWVERGLAHIEEHLASVKKAIKPE